MPSELNTHSTCILTTEVVNVHHKPRGFLAVSSLPLIFLLFFTIYGVANNRWWWWWTMTNNGRCLQSGEGTTGTLHECFVHCSLCPEADRVAICFLHNKRALAICTQTITMGKRRWRSLLRTISECSTSIGVIFFGLEVHKRAGFTQVLKGAWKSTVS